MIPESPQAGSKYTPVKGVAQGPTGSPLVVKRGNSQRPLSVSMGAERKAARSRGVEEWHMGPEKTDRAIASPETKPWSPVHRTPGNCAGQHAPSSAYKKRAREKLVWALRFIRQRCCDALRISFRLSMCLFYINIFTPPRALGAPTPTPGILGKTPNPFANAFEISEFARFETWVLYT